MRAAMMGTMYFLRANCAQYGGSASGGSLICPFLLSYRALLDTTLHNKINNYWEIIRKSGFPRSTLKDEKVSILGHVFCYNAANVSWRILKLQYSSTVITEGSIDYLLEITLTIK